MRTTSQPILTDNQSSAFIQAVIRWTSENPKYETDLPRLQSLKNGHYGIEEMQVTDIERKLGKADSYSEGLYVWTTAKPITQWPPGMMFAMPFGSTIASYFDSDKFWCWAEGSDACTTGQDWMENPYPVGTYEHRSWFTAWLCALLELNNDAMRQFERVVVDEATKRAQILRNETTRPQAAVSVLAKEIWEITSVAELADAGLSKTTVEKLRDLQSACNTLLTVRAGFTDIHKE